MTGLLEGRTAIITGAGTGIGRGLATVFAREGARVVCMARSAQAQDATAAAIRAAGGEAITIQGDVTAMADVRRAVAAGVEAFGGIDIAVQVASHGHGSKPFDLGSLELAEYDLQSAVTLRGCYNLAQACYPWLARSGRGRYIGITSAHGLAGDATNPVYATIKGALRGFTKSLAKDWGDDKITVNLFAPSSMSEGTEEYFRLHPEALAGIKEMFPLGYMGDPKSDIAEAVLAIAGDQFRYVTGQTLPIDGGHYVAM